MDTASGRSSQPRPQGNFRPIEALLHGALPMLAEPPLGLFDEAPAAGRIPRTPGRVERPQQPQGALQDGSADEGRRAWTDR